MKGNFVLALFSIAFLVLACAPQKAEAPAALLQEKPDIAMEAKKTWEQEWESLVKAAQKEGKVVLYTTEGPQSRQALVEAFEKKYGISVETITARGPELVQKIFTERRAGIYMVDVFVSGVTNMTLSLKPAGLLDLLDSELLLPELKDPKLVEKLWHEGKIFFIDEATHTILSFSAYVVVPFSINTEVVKRDEIKSYKDLLQPKWKGKISMNTPAGPGPGGSWFSMSLWAKMVDVDYMRNLAKQDPMVLIDPRLQVDWLARGKYPIAIGTKTPIFIEFAKAGTPIERLPAPLEGAYISSGGGNISILKDRPHPNATRLYLNWLLTKEAQTLLSINSGRQSRRLDVPTNHLDSYQLLHPGAKYAASDSEEYSREVSKYYELGREIFGHLIR